MAANRDALARAQAQLSACPRKSSRDHRRRDQLRRQHRQLSGARCAVHARLRVSAHGRSGEGRAREPARSVLPRRARPVVRARQGNGHGRGHAQRQLRRRDGLGPVHALELSPVRGRRQRRRQARSVQRRRRHRGLGRQLLREEGRLEARRAGHGARDCAMRWRRTTTPRRSKPCSRAKLRSAGYRPQPAVPPTAPAQADPPGRRRGQRILDGVPQLPRDHEIQHVAPLCDGGVPVVRIDRGPRGAVATATQQATVQWARGRRRGMRRWPATPP